MAGKLRKKTAARSTGGASAMPRGPSDFEKLLQKALEDPEFARLLMLSPGEALKKLDIKVTQEKLRTLAECIDPIIEAYVAFGGMEPLIG
jgi:hypothetical protein